MKFSVIIPAYNCEKTIKECIESVLEQEESIEIIIVNNGSKDKTEEIIRSFGKKVCFINVESCGVSNARNIGLSLATGDYIMFVDADDTMLAGCMTYIKEKIIETDADIIRFEYYINKNGQLTKPLNYIEKEKFIDVKGFRDCVYPEFVNGILLNSLWVHCYRSSVLKGIYFRPGMITAEDACFNVQVYSKANNVLFLPNEFYIYNKSRNSLTGRGVSIIDKYKCNFILSFEIIKKLKKWDMNSPYWHIKSIMRPIVLTLDKIKRSKM